jgi:predicted nucleotide-binding protein
MQSAYAIIFDITDFNPNVMLELGIALELQQRTDCKAKVFLICRAEKYCHNLLPSDLSGYFLSTYKVDENKTDVTFGDGGSLVMRITSDVFEGLGISYIEQIQGV